MQKTSTTLRWLAIALGVAVATPALSAAPATDFYTSTIVVGAASTPTANGTALKAAVAAAANEASSDAAWLVKVEPGIYDLGTDQLAMAPWVDIEGSGINGTVIQGSGTFSSGDSVIKGANNAELRDLTVKCTGTGGCVAILNSNASPTIKGVYILASDIAGGALIGIYNDNSSPLIEDTSIRIALGAGDQYGVFNTDTAETGSGETFSFPILRRVEIALTKAYAGTTAVGVWSEVESNVKRLENVNIYVGNGGATTVIGVYQDGTEGLETKYYSEVTGSDIQVDSDDTTPIGILMQSSQWGLIVQRSRIRTFGSGTFSNAGIGVEVSSVSGGTVDILNADIRGMTTTVAGHTLRVGASRLNGGDTDGVVEQCGATVNSSYVEFNNTCRVQGGP